jgi:hypothetical protein
MLGDAMRRISRRQLLGTGIAIGGSLLARPVWPQGGPLPRGDRPSAAQGNDSFDWDATPDHGYDPTEPEPERPGSGVRALSAQSLPPSAVVDPAFLPPVGAQGHAGSCVSWAAGYGLATFMLAKKAGNDPTLPINQVSPAYLYSSVRNSLALGCRYDSGRQDLTCKPAWKSPNEDLGRGGTNIAMTLRMLQLHGATNCEQTPYPRVAIGGQAVAAGALYSNIYRVWSTTNAAPSLKIRDFHSYKFKGNSNPLADIKATLAGGDALVYGTREPTPWKPDDGSGPWEKYEDVKMDGDKPAGHVMLIIGYDDEMKSSRGKGAILLQNSWGPRWGISWAHAFGRHYQKPSRDTRGYVWITYEAFLALAQGTAFTAQV